MTQHTGQLRTLIVDDEPLAQERMQVICAKLQKLSVVGTAGDGSSALRLMDALRPDLVLLDVTMPQLNGLSVAKTIAQRDLPVAVIFVTAHDGHALEAFDLNAVDYVLKPVEAERLERAIDRAMLRRGMGEPRKPGSWLQELWVPHKSELVRVSMDDVSQIDAERDYVRLHLKGRSYLLLRTIAALEQQLDPDQFIRVHRSTIVRRSWITGLRHDGLGTWSVDLLDGGVVRIGRTYLARVKAMASK